MLGKAWGIAGRPCRFLGGPLGFPGCLGVPLAALGRSEASMGVDVSAADSFVMYTKCFICVLVVCLEIARVNSGGPVVTRGRDWAE